MACPVFTKHNLDLVPVNSHIDEPPRSTLPRSRRAELTTVRRGCVGLAITPPSFSIRTAITLKRSIAATSHRLMVTQPVARMSQRVGANAPRDDGLRDMREPAKPRISLRSSGLRSRGAPKEGDHKGRPRGTPTGST
jgi:hypothetical protein